MLRDDSAWSLVSSLKTDEYHVGWLTVANRPSLPLGSTAKTSSGACGMMASWAWLFETALRLGRLNILVQCLSRSLLLSYTHLSLLGTVSCACNGYAWAHFRDRCNTARIHMWRIRSIGGHALAVLEYYYLWLGRPV